MLADDVMEVINFAPRWLSGLQAIYHDTIMTMPDTDDNVIR
jgi:hypothetical protein